VSFLHTFCGGGFAFHGGGGGSRNSYLSVGFGGRPLKGILGGALNGNGPSVGMPGFVLGRGGADSVGRGGASASTLSTSWRSCAMTAALNFATLGGGGSLGCLGILALMVKGGSMESCRRWTRRPVPGGGGSLGTRALVVKGGSCGFRRRPDPGGGTWGCFGVLLSHAPSTQVHIRLCAPSGGGGGACTSGGGGGAPSGSCCSGCSLATSSYLRLHRGSSTALGDLHHLMRSHFQTFTKTNL
jgi:hypothetical protein